MADIDRAPTEADAPHGVTRYMQWPLAVMPAQHFLALSSHFILAFSQVLFIVGGALFGPVPATAGAVKARAMANANIETRVFIGFLLTLYWSRPSKNPPIVGACSLLGHQ